jgi:hypothetical protein
MKKNILLIAISGLIFMPVFICAQHLYSVNYNDLSKENLSQLKTEIANLEISSLSLSRNNGNNEVFSIAFSSVQNTKIIILNEHTGNNVVIMPVAETLQTMSLPVEFQLAPFFIEELRQAVLGEASRYLIIETGRTTSLTDEYSVKNVASVFVNQQEVYIPHYFYGSKENVQEALPINRKIIHIFKEKPIYFPAFPNEPENLQYVEQLEEAMSYYVYMYQLPDSTLCIYDEHFNHDNDKTVTYVGGNLEFFLSGTLNAEQLEASEYALELWGEQLGGIIPVDISISVFNFPSPDEDKILGRAYRQPMYNFNNTWCCSALGNQLAGYNVQPAKKDIVVEMNSFHNFYFGVDGKTPYSAYDFLTIMLHEVTHGLGFFPLCNNNGEYRYVTVNQYGENVSLPTPYPGAFDRQLFQGLAGPCITELTQLERKALTISNNLYAGAPGSNLLAANDGIRVKMYAPTTYNSGSSNSHWDNSVGFKTFMKYSIGKGSSNALHTFNTRKIGILLDLGWTLPVQNPNTLWIIFKNNIDEEDTYTQQFLPGVEKKLKPNLFKREGYTFINWNTKSDGTGTSYEEREMITVSQDFILYAQWEANTYTLSFNPNGGTVNQKSKQVTFDAPVGELPIPEKENWRFEEWRISNVVINEETIWNYSINKIAVARWILDNSITGIQQKEIIQIIPNPANQTIELRITISESQFDKIEFFNNFGQLVKTVPFTSDFLRESIIQKIDISDLCAGLYMVKMGKRTVKLIVN